MLSTRNQLKSRIKAVNTGDVVSELVLDLGGQEICAIITTGSVQKMDLKVGDEVVALVKATSVGIMN